MFQVLRNTHVYTENQCLSNCEGGGGGRGPHIWQQVARSVSKEYQTQIALEGQGPSRTQLLIHSAHQPSSARYSKGFSQWTLWTTYLNICSVSLLFLYTPNLNLRCTHFSLPPCSRPPHSIARDFFWFPSIISLIQLFVFILPITLYHQAPIVYDLVSWNSFLSRLPVLCLPLLGREAISAKRLRPSVI